MPTCIIYYYAEDKYSINIYVILEFTSNYIGDVYNFDKLTIDNLMAYR